MFRVKQSCIETLGEHVIFIHKDAVLKGNLGFRPLDRVRVVDEERIFEIHAQSKTQFEFGRGYAEAHPEIIQYGF